MIGGYHQTSFPFDARRERLWATLCESDFQEQVAPDWCVLDLGAGYGNFVNNIRGRRKIALDDYTPVSVYSDRSLVDFIEAHGFRVLKCHPRFLPLTIKSRFPVFPLLIRAYLGLPFKPMGKQMLIREGRA